MSKLKKGLQDQQNIDDGFSSDQQVKQEQIIIGQFRNEVEQNIHKEEVKFKLPPPPQIRDKSYSLHPDIATGWAPKVELPSPIPLVFDNNRLDNFIKVLLKYQNEAKKNNNQNQKQIHLCYLGPRYQNTYYSWYDKPFAFPYTHIKGPNDIKFTNRPFCGQHWDSQDALLFDSFFQSGNLDCAVRIEERQYELFIRVDSNTKGHLQWYYFSVKNVKKLQKYKINICNFQKNKSLYGRGMKPYIFSLKRFDKKGVSWQQGGQNIKYEKRHLKSAKMLNYQYPKSYRLSFQFYTQYQNDQIMIAYCVPYTYTRLTKFLSQITQKTGSTYMFNKDSDMLKMSKLCTTLGGLEVPLIIVNQKDSVKQTQETELNSTTASSNPQKKNTFKINKKCVIVSGRAHPGQSNGSFMMEGFIQFICGNSKMAQQLRKYIIFKIVPMLNPDGVALGNYRTGISGKDFNREFRNPDKVIFPQIYAIKKLVSQNKQIFKENLIMFLDFHGHSVKKNVFMYGPQFPIIERYYYQTRIFPKILGNHTKMFRYYSCIFKISEFKLTTARAVVLRKMGIPFTYTIEASNGSYYNHQTMKDIPFAENSWKDMGISIGTALSQYLDMLRIAQQYKIKKQMQKQKMNATRRNFAKSTKTRLSRSINNGVENEIPSLILPGMQDDKIKSLLKEIKQAQQHKQQARISDDQLSEGSSDGEDQTDDLSTNKLNFLYQIIKNKKSRSRNIDRMHEEFKQRCSTNQKKQTQEERKSNQTDQINQKVVSQMFGKKQLRQNRRSFLGRSKNKNNDAIFQSDPKRSFNTTARVINFSFGVNSPCRGKSLQQKMGISRINFMDLSSNKLFDEKKVAINNANKVLDLSDNFRKTFSYGLKQKSQIIEKPLQQAQLRSQTIFMHQGISMNRRPRRFEQYKIKKIPAKNPFF